MVPNYCLTQAITRNILYLSSIRSTSPSLFHGPKGTMIGGAWNSLAKAALYLPKVIKILLYPDGDPDHPYNIINFLLNHFESVLEISQKSLDTL